MARVTLLSVDGCPNAPSVHTSLRSLAAELGFDLEHRRVASSAEAEHLGFPGSPTVLIDGRDPFHATAEAGLSCRLYATEDGLRGVPPRKELREALRAATDRSLRGSE
jgi:hypothetical protein